MRADIAFTIETEIEIYTSTCDAFNELEVIFYTISKIMNSVFYPIFMNYVHPTGGGHIIFAFSVVCRPDAWFPLI